MTSSNRPDSFPFRLTELIRAPRFSHNFPLFLASIVACFTCKIHLQDGAVVAWHTPALRRDLLITNPSLHNTWRVWIYGLCACTKLNSIYILHINFTLRWPREITTRVPGSSLWVHCEFIVSSLWVHCEFTVNIHCEFTVSSLWIFTVSSLWVHCEFTVSTLWVSGGYALHCPFI